MLSNSGVIESKDKPLITSKREELKARYEEKEGNKKLQFLFPFQRRARSHSPPSEEQIQNKIAAAINSNIKGEKERSWSKSLEHTKNSSAVVANTSFMIGGLDFSKDKKFGRSRKGITREEKEMMKSKEVEEWLK